MYIYIYYICVRVMIMDDSGYGYADCHTESEFALQRPCAQAPEAPGCNLLLQRGQLYAGEFA